jgi:hypothetical protein
MRAGDLHRRLAAPGDRDGGTAGPPHQPRRPALAAPGQAAARRACHAAGALARPATAQAAAATPA